jgi:tRNA(fMet)-specific endonuclease VapC
MTYLLDTDTVNYLIKGVQPVKRQFRSVTRDGASFALSMIVHYEVSRYLRLRTATRSRRFYEQLTANWAPIGLTEADWETAIDLWVRRHRAGRPIEDADLLIAVTALKAGAVLVTNNASHFIDLGLTVENWMQASSP